MAAVKRKISDEESKTSENLKKQRLSKNHLYRLPTAEELNMLKETVNEFHSTLFRFQIEEMLKNVKISNRRKTAIEQWLAEFREVLRNTKPSKKFTDNEWIKKCGVEVPLICQHQTSSTFRFYPPSEMKLVGSLPLGLAIKSDAIVDLAVEMPSECWEDGDHTNHVYHRKRALYLVYLVRVLQGHDLVADLNFSLFNGNHMKPVLLIKPKGDAGKYCTVRVLPHLPSSVFSLEDLCPTRCNIDPDWWFGNKREDDLELATAHYNSSIVEDTTMVSHLQYLQPLLTDCPSIIDALYLLKVWLHQRELDLGADSVTGFFIIMFVAYLIQTRRINPQMSCYQIFRLTLVGIGQQDLTGQGLSLSQCTDQNAPTIADFFVYFPVVFVGPSGYNNLCSGMSRHTYLRLKHEADQSIKSLDNNEDAFDSLFMSKLSFINKFDYFVHLPELNKLEPKLKELDIERDIQDRCGNFVAALAPKIVDLISKALEKRCLVVDVRREATVKWPVSSAVPNHPTRLTLGLVCNMEHYSVGLEEGPPGNTFEATRFKDFWGPVSTLHRFPDSSIKEAIQWPGSNMAERRLISDIIIRYILERFLFYPPEQVNFVGGQLEGVLVPPISNPPANWPAYGAGEEVCIRLNKTFDDFRRDLRCLSDPALSITGVVGLSAAFRFTEVFPPLSLQLPEAKEKYISGQHTLANPQMKTSPNYVHPLEVLVMFEVSGKWPSDMEALRRVKAAFHIQMADELRKQYRYTCHAFPDYLDVLKDGYVFRLRIGCHKELVVSQIVKTGRGTVRKETTEKSKELQFLLEHLPKLSSALHGVQQRFNTFSAACRLAKRWVSAHLLADYVPDLVIELIVASLYISPYPYTSPCSPQVGFIRFLQTLCSTNWESTPIIVNLNDELTKEDYNAVQSKFITDRESLPPVFIATPYDKDLSSYTCKQPSQSTWDRLIALAKESLTALEPRLLGGDADDYRVIFRTPLDHYDVLLHLNAVFMLRRHEGVDAEINGRFLRDVTPYRRSKGEKLPVTGFDPPQLYLKELRESFSDFADFYYDLHGGDVIAAVFKPAAFGKTTFKISALNCRVPDLTSNDKVTNLHVNVASLIEDMVTMGTGLVTHVTTRTEKWNFD